MEIGAAIGLDVVRVTSRFFIDECLSAALVAVAKDRGIAAAYGPHIGMAGWQDWNIATFAIENDYVVVTNNRRDFLKEYLRHDLHPGLIVIVPHLDRSSQMRLFNRVIEHLANQDVEPVNLLVEALADGAIISRTWTRLAYDPTHVGNPQWS